MAEITATPIHSVTTERGLTLTSQMSPEARFSAISKSMGAPALPVLDSRIGPPLHSHTDSIGGKLVDAIPDPPATVTTSVPASKPTAPMTAEQSAAAAAKVAAFDAEMRAAGKQVDPNAPAVDTQTPNQEGIAALSKAYTRIMRDLESGMPSIRRDQLIAEKRARYQTELVEFHNGRRLDESREEFAARQAGNAPGSQTPVSPHSPQVWAEAHVSVADKEGYVPLNRLNPAGLSGYTLPKLLPDQTYHVSTFQMLANARAQGLSQKQVDGFVRQDMQDHGWIKS